MNFIKFLLYFLLFSRVSVFAQNEINSSEDIIDYPVPTETENLLFYIQRSMNKNTIAYELNLDDENNLIEDAPVHAYWIRYQDDGECKELSYVEQKFAYGIKAKKKEADKSIYEISLVSHPLKMQLQKLEHTEDYKVFISINNKLLELKKIFFKTDGGSFWNPILKYIDITGVNVKTQLEVCERIQL